MTTPTKQQCRPSLPRGLIPPSSPKTRATAEAGAEKSHYKPLPKEFGRDAFTYCQIARENDAAIYEQTWNDCHNPSVCFEVIRIRRREGFEIGGRFVEAAEIYPKAETWGTDGFTLTDKDAAFRKLREIVESSSAVAHFKQKESWPH